MNAYKKGLKHSHCLNSYEEEAKGISLTNMTNDSEDNDDEGYGKDDMKPQISYCAASTSPIRPPLPSENRTQFLSTLCTDELTSLLLISSKSTKR